MRATTITPTELKEWHRLRAELETAAATLFDAQQTTDRAKMRLARHLTGLNRKYVIRAGQDIDEFGNILRQPAAAEPKP